jgi:hypothetical protein
MICAVAGQEFSAVCLALLQEMMDVSIAHSTACFQARNGESMFHHQ